MTASEDIDVGIAIVPGHYRNRGCFIDRVRGVFAIIDGMGGQGSGSFALDDLTDQLSSALRGSADSVTAVERAMRDTHVYFRARPEEPKGLLASATALIVEHSTVAIAHIGGCAAYRLRDGELSRRTRDDTLGPQSPPLPPNLLRRCLGTNEEPLIQVVREPCSATDTYALLTEAPTDARSTDELLDALRETPQAAADALVQTSHARAPAKNATVIVLRLAGGVERL